MSAALTIFLTFFFSYFKSTFACLQMYIASRAATVKTTSEQIVNIIILFLSQSFNFLLSFSNLISLSLQGLSVCF